MREVNRFGHAAKVWQVIFALGYVPVIWIGPHRINEGWLGFIEIMALWTFVGGAQLWIQMSQRVWYDDQRLCTRISGRKGAMCMSLGDIASIKISHSWKRAAERRPLDELRIEA